jgi:hypothetical protein
VIKSVLERKYMPFYKKTGAYLTHGVNLEVMAHKHKSEKFEQL